jgi:outer membrane protein assembly factor BamB
MIAMLLLASMIPAGMLSEGFADEASTTYEVWEFGALGDVLVMSTIKDLSGDDIDDLVVAAQDKSIYLIDASSGKKLWTYTGSDYYEWIAVLTSSLDANEDGKPDVLAATNQRLVIMLDGETGEQIWNRTAGDSQYESGDLCYPFARSLNIVSDIDDDGLPDVVVVSGSGDKCPKDDKLIAVAFSTKSGEKIWEYDHDEDYHGLKDGVKASSPIAIIDANHDDNLDVIVIDDHSVLYTINGLTGNIIETKELDVFGAVWNLMVVPDISGDDLEDAIAFEFIDGSGGPDYASVDALDLESAEVMWQAKVGDGLYNGGAVYSAAIMPSKGGSSPAGSIVSVTQRIENELRLILRDADTGQEVWQFDLGEDRGRNDLEKYYPIAIVPDFTNNGYDEIGVGSIDSKLYLLDQKDGMIIWSHSVTGGVGLINSIAGRDGQRYVNIADGASSVRSLAALTTIETELTIDASEQVIVEGSKIMITGAISPALAGEIVQLRYIDPTGFVMPKPIVVAKDGSYADTIEPEILGEWKVNARFEGEGYYTSAESSTITFTVENETKNSVYRIQVRSDDNTNVSYPIVYFIDGGNVTQMSIDKQQKSLNIAIRPSSGGGALRLELSREIIDAWQSSYQVRVDGKTVSFQELEADLKTRVLTIPFSNDAKQIQVIGTYVVPEFPMPSIVIVALVGMIAIIAMRVRLFSRKTHSF